MATGWHVSRFWRWHVVDLIRLTRHKSLAGWNGSPGQNTRTPRLGWISYATMSVMLVSAWRMLVDIVRFWHRKLIAWLHRRAPIDIWLEILHTATDFEEWDEAALQLDNLLGLDIWRNNPTSRHYDYRLIHERLARIHDARDDGDIHALVNLLRSGLVRNLGNITAPKLYNGSFAGTKYLIEEYITNVAQAIEDIGRLPTPAEAEAMGLGPVVNFDDGGGGGGGIASGELIGVGIDRMPIAAMSTQTKLDFIHDTRQAFGRTSLVLQGGAIFGLCHLGIIKALFLRGLLPRIITGTATGALMAALVAIHTEEELPRVLSGDGIDLSAFAGRTKAAGSSGDKGMEQSFWSELATAVRRVQRFWREGHFLDVKVLEDCVRANVGDLTFEEAYQRSKRVLNITVATAGQGGVPTLLNYLTAPNVLVWTAAVASNASTTTLYGDRETRILCKDPKGNIIPWTPADTADFRHWTHASYSDRESPLLRVAELFNVNHFIVSQARPYLIPFLQSDMHGPSLVETRSKTTSVTAFLVRMMGLEVRHRLKQLDALSLLPAAIRRFLVDEIVPGASMTLVPEVTVGDFVRLLETPTKETLEYWILRGERSVWPAVSALKIRCAIETELDRAYQQARRLKAGGLRRKGSSMMAMAAALAEGREREREREQREREQREREQREREQREREKERDRAHSTGARRVPSA
ncbi:acyl transferase/acyl hydrolase/lysophospholipase [Podospora appendiculata]|uniref:Patatin-like phospholipase domain-containing protein n=1 Tax=Podospora appendiculata TaxID=314037 RepID=A0AAE0XKY4_9PEZI|nr:acyl transferase/acyl hydrolase/lysophospholipase [Podospora appendiculata]